VKRDAPRRVQGAADGDAVGLGHDVRRDLASGLGTAAKITVYGRDPTGAIRSHTVTLNGQNWVTGSPSFERSLYSAFSGATPIGSVANPSGTAADLQDRARDAVRGQPDSR